MKTQLKRTLIVAATLILPFLAQSANVSLTASDPIGTSSFNSAGKWSNAQAPSAANDYFTSSFFLRTPGDSGSTTWTFAGHSMTLQQVSGQGQPMRSIIVKSGNNDTFVINNLTNATGGVINNGGSGFFTETFTGNLLTIAGNSTIIADQGPMIIGYPIVGTANLTNSGSAQSGAKSVTYTGDLSGFTGRLILFNLGGGITVDLNAANSIPGNPAALTPDQITIGPSCTLVDNVGLTFNNANGGFTLTGNGNVNSASTTVLAEPITDNGAGFSLTAGAGTLVLSNANNTYTGGTVASVGATLRVGLANTMPAGNVTANGTFDINAISTTIGALIGSGTVDTLAGGTPTLAIGANNASGTFTGTIQNSGGTLSLLKVGTGTQTIGGVSGGYTYSGQTLVAGGTLDLINSVGIVPSAPGDLIVSNGATLAVDTSSGISAVPANNVVVKANSTLSLTPNPANAGISVAGNLTLQDNASNTFNYGTLSANPTAPEAINVTGSIVAAPTVSVINITGFGFTPGTFTLIKYGGTPLSTIATFSLVLPPGVVGSLVNNTGNNSIDLNITSAPRSLSWNGVGGTTWDLSSVNWSNASTASLTAYQQGGSPIAGDGVLFDDSLTNDFVNPQPTNINVTATFYPVKFVVNSTVPYSFSGAGGIAGTTSILKSNTASLTLLTSNGFTGGLFVEGGSVVITNDNALGASGVSVTLNGSALQINGNTTSGRPISMPAASTIGVGAGSTATLGGVISGAGVLNKNDNGTLVLTAPETFTGNAFLHAGTTIIDSGGSITNSVYDDVGQNGTDAATLTLKGTGSLGTANDFNVGDIDSSSGALNVQDSATLFANQIFVASANASGSTASGIVNQSGGTVIENSTAVGAFAIGGRTSALGVGIYNLSGGTVTAHAGVRVGGAGTGTVNQSGGTFNAMQGINIARLTGSSGTYNLNGGTLATFNATSSTAVNAIFNFNGGVLLAAFTNATPFMSGLSQANVLSGGAIIDDGGNNVTIPQPLLAGSPSGGLTKQGSGTLTLTGTNTFTGPVLDNAGTLVLNTSSSYPGGASIANGAVLSLVQIGSATETLGNVTFNGNASVPGATIGLAVTAANNPAIAVVNCGTLTLNGINSITLAGSVNVGTIALIKAVGAISGSGSLTNLVLPQGATGSISTSFDGTYTTISAVITSTGPGLVWTGTNSAPGLTNLWNINSATNWLLGSTPTTYQQVVVPGDAVTFNDAGSGVVLLTNTVGPASLTISNNAKNYTFGGKGTITGPASLTKLGSGTASLNLTNDSYSGGTTVSGGTLQLGSGTAISSGNVSVGAGSTLELAGSSITIGELSGSGIVDNNSGLIPVITMGTSAGSTWGGTITNTGGSGVSLHKVGTGTWVVSGKNHLDDGQTFTDRNQINQGAVVITNGGLVGMAYLQMQIASGASQTGAVVVAGGTLLVTNNVLSVGYGDSSANGTLTVNSGTVDHSGLSGGTFAAVPNSIDVGAQGSTGKLIVNGGQVLSDTPIYIGDGTTGNGTLYLNGGLVRAAAIQPNSTPASSVAYFNGGTLQAATNSPDFIVAGTTPYIQSGGLTLDDNGFAVSIASQGLQEDPSSTGGALTKKGSGTLYLDSVNSYSGSTVVTNGVLAGVGSITGPLVVASSGKLGAGDAAGIGTFMVNNNVTLQGGVAMRINRDIPTSDLVMVSGNISYGGALVVSNLSTTALTTNDTFQLFSVSGAESGNFGSIVGSPGAGLAYNFNPTNGVLSVVSNTIATNPTNITFAVSGSTLTLSWPSDHLGWILQSQTNSLSTGLGTAWFDVAGSGSTTQAVVNINPANPTVFFRLRSP